MVLEVITPKLQEEMIRMCKFYDKYGILPNKKVRIDVTISQENLIKLNKVKNKSKFIDDLLVTNLK